MDVFPPSAKLFHDSAALDPRTFGGGGGGGGGGGECFNHILLIMGHGCVFGIVCTFVYVQFEHCFKAEISSVKCTSSALLLINTFSLA